VVSRFIPENEYVHLLCSPKEDEPEVEACKESTRQRAPPGTRFRLRRNSLRVLGPAGILETPPFGRQIEAGGRKSIRPAQNPFSAGPAVLGLVQGGRKHKVKIPILDKSV